jgi:hypothetical protein
LKRISILLVALLALVTVACGSEQTTPSETPETTPTPTVEATESPSATADSTDEATDDGEGTSEQNELADIVPTEVDGIAVEYEFATGADFEDGTEMDPEAREFLDQVGGDVDRMSSALGLGLDAEAGRFVTIIVFRIPGADEQALLDQFEATLADDEAGLEFAPASVDGKQVLTATSEEQGTLYLYADDDTLFAIGGSTPELGEAALSEIP